MTINDLIKTQIYLMQQQNFFSTQSILELLSIQSNEIDQEVNLLNFQSSISSNFDKTQIQLPMDQKKCKKKKPIQRKPRVLKPNSKWTSKERIHFFKSILKLQNKNLSRGFSWTYWKAQGTFDFIAQDMKTKDNTQVKSFDLRMKKEFLQGKGMDLIPAALFMLQGVRDSDQQAKQLLDQYYGLQQMESQHMKIVERRKCILSQMDKMIQQFTQLTMYYQRRGFQDGIFMDQE